MGFTMQKFKLCQVVSGWISKRRVVHFRIIDMTYPDLVKGILKDYPRNNFINTICDGVKIGEPFCSIKRQIGS
jgi:hypothetical protein